MLNGPCSFVGAFDRVVHNDVFAFPACQIRGPAGAFQSTYGRALSPLNRFLRAICGLDDQGFRALINLLDTADESVLNIRRCREGHRGQQQCERRSEKQKSNLGHLSHFLSVNHLRYAGPTYIT